MAARPRTVDVFTQARKSYWDGGRKLAVTKSDFRAFHLAERGVGGRGDRLCKTGWLCVQRVSPCQAPPQSPGSPQLGTWPRQSIPQPSDRLWDGSHRRTGRGRKLVSEEVTVAWKVRVKGGELASSATSAF